MMKQTLFCAAIALSVAFSSAGCDIENCKTGEKGCLNGAPTDDGKCLAGLELVGGKCVEKGSGGSGGTNGGSGDDGGATTGDDACNGMCEESEICLEKSKTCADFCEEPDELPGSGSVPELISCGGEPDGAGGELALTFEDNCKNRCLLDCRWSAWFCGESCDPNYCNDAARQTECAADFGSDVAMVAEACREAHARTCDGGKMCEGGKAPKCDDVTCSNECGGAAQNLFDGYCDDGSYSNSSTNFCPFGSDCADCGPRLGKARPEDTGLLKTGDLCPNSWRCGHSSNYAVNPAWCLLVPGGVDGLARCMPDCSGEDEDCPQDFECKGISLDPDRNGVKPRGCFPIEEKYCE